MNRTPIACSLFALCSCGVDPSVVPEIASKDEERGTELTFKMASHATTPSGSQFFKAVGTLNGRPVGFDLELGPWCENPPGFVNMVTWDCKAHLRSQGAASDEFVRYLDTLYGTHQSPSRMVDTLEFSILSPWENPGFFEDGAIKLLLLLPTGFDGFDSPEVWLEIDTEDQRIYWREKEPRLRKNVVAVLSAAE